MEISSVNVQVKAPTTKDASLKPAAAKGDDSEFSKVYKDVSNKTNSETTQTKLTPAKKEDNQTCKKDDNLSTDTSEAKPAEVNAFEDDAAKDDKDLNWLIQLLLLSGNANQNLLSLLKSNGNVDAKEIKDLISKILNDNLSSNLSAKTNSPNLSTGSPLDEISKILSISNGALAVSIDKLASKIADKLSTDSTFKENLLAMLKVNPKENVTDIPKESTTINPKDNALYKLILNELKTLTKNDNTNADYKASKASSIQDLKFPQTNENVAPNVKTVYQTSYSSATEVSAATESKTTEANAENLTSKDDEILKQLLGNDSSKDSKADISDKIANVLNRFETLKVDNQPLTDGKLSINKTTLNEDIIKAVKFMDVNNIKELSVKVIPKELGEVVIRLSMDNGIMKANITAANKDTYNLLNSQLPAINNELAKQNMTIQNFSLTLYNGDNFLFNGDGSSNGNGKQQNKSSIKVDSLEESEILNENYLDENNTVNLLA